MNLNVRPLSRSKDLVVQELADEILIYNLNTNKAFCLNITSAVIWQMCDGTKTLTQISEEVSRKLKTSLDEDFIWLALDDLKKKDLINNSAEIADTFQKMSRREVIRKIGLTSAATLPVILALSAPTAAQTASQCAAPSNRPNGCACSLDTQCSPASFCCVGICLAGTVPCIT